MKDKKLHLELLPRTSESDEAQPVDGCDRVGAIPVLNLADATSNDSDGIDVIESETVLVLPTHYECSRVPQPEGLQ